MKQWLSDRWHLLLVFLHLRPDFRNPEFSPPAFPDEHAPHAFQRFEGSLVCGKCGGGRLHKVHTAPQKQAPMSVAHDAVACRRCGWTGMHSAMTYSESGRRFCPTCGGEFNVPGGDVMPAT